MPPASSAQWLATRSAADCLQGSPDTYAVVTLYDPYRKPIPNIEYKSGG